MNTPEIYAAAKDYISRGWHIFPLHSIENGRCTCGRKDCSTAGKHPRTADGLKSATADAQKIEEWFSTTAPAANIAIATGKVSNLTVYDIDIGDDKNGADTWIAALGEAGEPRTLMAKTGSGGMHVFFKYNSALKTRVNALGDGVDIRNDGGYVVAAPSIHKSGRNYEWIDAAVPLDDVPAVLSRFSVKKKRKFTPQKYSLAEVEKMLDCVDGTDYDVWRKVGIILGRTYPDNTEAWELYHVWADRYQHGAKGRDHDKKMHEAFFELPADENAEFRLTIATLVSWAYENGYTKPDKLSVDDFIFYMPDGNYIDLRTGTPISTATAVDAALGKKGASAAVREKNLCTCKICDPKIGGGFLRGYLNINGTLVESVKDAVYNIYRPPTIDWETDYNIAEAEKFFVTHIKYIFQKDGDADQFLDYMAHLVQKPWDKPRFALVIGGGQGVGKDTAIDFCTPAIGEHNVANIAPKDLSANFNEFATRTLVRINEAANLHDTNKWEFNELVKNLIAGVPDTVTINPKYGKQFQHRMHCGVIITTNHLLGGLYIPPDDRRYDIIQAASFEDMTAKAAAEGKKYKDENGEEKEIDFSNPITRRKYFDALWDWYNNKNGKKHVAALLHTRDIKNFSAALGQRKTEAHRKIVSLGLSGDQWLDDILCTIGNGEPWIVRGDALFAKAVENGEKPGTIKAKMAQCLERAGFELYRNAARADGRWQINGKRTAIYIKRGYPPPDNIELALEQQEQF